MIYLPYAIERIDDGRYVVLNRRYKPLGIHASAFIAYAPHAVHLLGLDEDTARKLSHKGSPDTACIWLYGDASTPLESTESWDAYQRRLQLLAALKVS